MRPHTHRQAFSLVELSIVLVILGLLAGGVLSGQALIRAAELRSVTADFARYNTSIRTFQDKYMAMPGDMPNATLFWGERVAGHAGDLTCHDKIGVTAGTCNGDGDGLIRPINSDTLAGEEFLAFQHLAKAGLIEGSYTGASADADAIVRSAGINVPSARISNGMYIIAATSPLSTSDPHYFDGFRSGNILSVKSKANGGLIKPEEMWNIDTKLDDGRPASGKVYVYKKSSTLMPDCATGDTLTASYNLVETGLKCYPLMYIN